MEKKKVIIRRNKIAFTNNEAYGPFIKCQQRKFQVFNDLICFLLFVK